jgi:hypothetical protein
MSKPVKSEAELIAMARAELKVHADCPDGIEISVIRDGDSWEFRANADAATSRKPGYPECGALRRCATDHAIFCHQFGHLRASSHHTMRCNIQTPARYRGTAKGFLPGAFRIL